MYAWNGLILELDKFRTRDSEGWHLQFPTDGLAESMTLQLYVDRQKRPCASGLAPHFCVSFATRPHGRMKMLQTQRVRFVPSPPSKTMRLLAELNQPTAQVPSVWCVRRSLRRFLPIASSRPPPLVFIHARPPAFIHAFVDSCQDDGSGTVTCPFNLHPSRTAASSSATSSSASGPAAASGHEHGGAGSSAGMDASFAGHHAGTDMEDLAMYFNDRACLPSSDPMSAWLAPPDAAGALTDPWVAGMDDSGASPRQGVLDPYYQTSALFAGAKLDDFDSGAAASAAALPPLVPSSASGTAAERRRPGKARSTTPQVKDSPPTTPALLAGAAAGAATSSSSSSAGTAVPAKSRSCEASARYRRRKQSELEILRKQYLDMFAENKRLAERIDELEEANRRLTTRLLLYEPPLG